jgi:uncharacterized membrane protein YheB (UPF0754 family)
VTPGLFREVLSWVVPPVIGAVIGYVTNDIAIRMLFRPLREVRLFGLRLPFTPGIFPRERRALSRSIGRMVSSELITEEALRRQVHSEKAQLALARSVSSVTAQVMESPLSALTKTGASAVASLLQDVLHDLLSRLFSSRTLAAQVRVMVGRAVASLSSRSLREVAERLDLKSFITGRILPLLSRVDTRQSIGRAVATALRRKGRSMVSDRLLDSASRAVEPLLPQATARLSEWLRSADMRRELEKRGARLLSRILEKLNLLQRFVVSAGQFDRRLAEKMPEMVEEAIVSLESLAQDPETQRRFLSVLVQAARDWRDNAEGTRANHAEQDAGSGRLVDAVQPVVDQVLGGLAGEDARQSLYAGIEAALGGVADQTFGGFTSRTLGISDDEVVDWLTTQVLGFLARPETARTLSVGLVKLTAGFVDDNGSVPLGEVLRIDAVRKERLDAFLLTKLVEVIDARLPEILRGLDVESLVVDKIDGLDVRDVERLILQVIAAHLKWIDVFGALLGFLIGLLQNALRLARLW